MIAPRTRRGLRASLLGAVAVAAAGLAGPALAQTQAPATGALTVLLQQARHWQEQNRPDLALLSFDRALAADPRNAEALAGAAQAQAAMGNRQAAEALLARLRAVAPGSAGIANAQEALRGAAVSRDTITEARRLSREGRVPEALTLYRDAFAGGPPPDAYAVEYWLTLAGTPGGWEEGRRQLAALAARRPDDSRARIAAAQVLTWREPTRAQGITELAQLARDPATAPQAIQAWRQALLWLGTGPSSEGPLEAFLAVRPGDAAIERRLAEVRDPTRRAAEAGAETRQTGFERLEANQLLPAAQAFEAALARNPDDADALGGLGVVRLRQGRVAEARGLLERAIAANPARAANWQAALDGASYSAELAEGRAQFRRGDVDAAEATLRRAVARNPTDPTDAEALLGDIALRRNDAAAAEQRFRTALARRPNFQPAMQGLERALRQQGRTAEADDLARRIRVASPATGGGVSGNAARLRAEAARAPDAGTAATLLRAALAEAPNDPWIRLDLARALARQGDGAEARAVIEAPLAGAQANSDALFAAALFAEEQGRMSDAAALIARVPPGRRSPDMARLAQRTRIAAEVEDAAIAAAAGGFDGRQRLLAIAARQDATGATAAAVIRAFGQMGNARGAEEAARVAMAVNRSPSATARLAIGGALLGAGLEQQAAAMVRGLESDPRLTAENRRQAEAVLAGIAVRASDRANEEGNQAAGFDRLRPVLARSPDDPAANLALARLYEGANRPAEAQRIAEAVLARDPRNMTARAGAVDAAIAARNWRQAQTLVDEGRALAPNEARVSLMQARLYRAQGDNRGALRAARLAEEQRRSQIGEVVPIAFLPGEMGGSNPFQTTGVTVGAPITADPLSADIARELAAAREATATRFTASPYVRSRSGTAGLDRLNEVAMPIEASVAAPGIGGRLTGTVTPVSVTSGSLPADLVSLQSFGANPIAYPGGMLPPSSDTAGGVALNLAYQRDWFRADVGSTPLGFRFNNVVGGVEVSPGLGGGWRVRVAGERRAVTDSLLSWAGQRDALTGQAWGGVVRTGGRAQVEYARGNGSLYAGGGYAVFDGTGVADNSRVEAGAGGSYAVVRRPDESLNVGLDLVYFAYDKNLRFFTLGQGGYFSPQSYTALNIPVDWRARSGDWSWRLGGSIGYAVWSEDQSPVFPNDSGLQAQLAAQGASNPLLVVTNPSQSQSGVIGSLRADLEYALTHDLALGAMLRYDRAADWNEARAGVFVRYRLPE